MALRQTSCQHCIITTPAVVPYTVGAFGVLARERFTGEDSGAALPCTGVGRLSPAIRAARRAEELEVPKMAPAGSAAVGPGLEDVAADLELQREYKHFEVLVEVPAEYEAYGSTVEVAARRDTLCHLELEVQQNIYIF